MQGSWIKRGITATLALLSCQLMAVDRVEIQIKGTVEPWVLLSAVSSDPVDLSSDTPQPVQFKIGFNTEKARVVLDGETVLSPIGENGSSSGGKTVLIKVSCNGVEITRSIGPEFAYSGKIKDIEVMLERVGELEDDVEYEGNIPLTVIANYRRGIMFLETILSDFCKIKLMRVLSYCKKAKFFRFWKNEYCKKGSLFPVPQLLEETQPEVVSVKSMKQRKSILAWSAIFLIAFCSNGESLAMRKGKSGSASIPVTASRRASGHISLNVLCIGCDHVCAKFVVKVELNKKTNIRGKTIVLSFDKPLTGEIESAFIGNNTNGRIEIAKESLFTEDDSIPRYTDYEYAQTGTDNCLHFYTPEGKNEGMYLIQINKKRTTDSLIGEVKLSATVMSVRDNSQDGRFTSDVVPVLISSPADHFFGVNLLTNGAIHLSHLGETNAPFYLKVFSNCQIRMEISPNSTNNLFTVTNDTEVVPVMIKCGTSEWCSTKFGLTIPKGERDVSVYACFGKENNEMVAGEYRGIIKVTVTPNEK